LGHIFPIFGGIIGDIGIIESNRNLFYLLKSIENVGMSICCKFSAELIQIQSSRPEKTLGRWHLQRPYCFMDLEVM